LRFAVHGLTQRQASPRRHGVPRRDIPGRVHVCVAGEIAGHAGEESLALAALHCDMPARRAALARVRGIDFLHPARGLVLQTAHQQAPARAHDLPIEAGFLAYIPARLLYGPLGGTRHMRDAKVFDSDHVKPARQVRGSLLSPILTDVLLMSSQLRDGQPQPYTAIRTSPGPGELALKAGQPALPLRAEPGNTKHLARRQRRAHGNATVDADHLTRIRRGYGVGYRCEGDVPAVRAVPRHAVGLYGRNGTRPAETNPPGLGYPHLASLAAQSAYMPRLHGDDTEALITSGFPPRRFAVRAGEETRHGLREVPECLLLHHLAACTQPPEISAGLGQLARLGEEPWRAAAPRTPPRLLLNSHVPHKPGVRAMVPQHYFLDGRRRQPIAGHSNTLATAADILGEVKRRFLLGPAAEVSTPHIR
jgi:hypothetical protein